MVLVLGLVASGCKTVAPFVATGETLAALDNQFADTGAAFNAGLDAGKLTPEQYRPWAEFGKRYKPLARMAVDAWKASIELNDKVLAGQFGAALGQLASELAVFYAQAKKAGLLPAGAP
jgi:hypothetical protein